MGDLPFVTIGIPCLNEEDFIEHTVGCALAQRYPADKLEVLVADGGSSDATRTILARLSREDPRVKMVDNPGRIQAKGMNEIIRQARGDVLVRFDAHAEYDHDYVRTCVEVLERTGADNVGGAQRAKAKTRFQRALCAALRSPLGVGGAKYRSADSEGFVDTVFLGAFRRRVFEQVGMFDPGAVTNEDADLNQRIAAAGGKVYLSRDIIAYYYPRDSLPKLSKQYFKYGVGRARTLLKHGRFPNPRPLVPFSFVLGGLGLLATRKLHPFTLPAFVSYAAITGLEALRVGREEGLWAVPVIWSIFPVLHISHGVGMGVGLLKYARDRDWSEPERIPPRAETLQSAD
jgi:cellulose synthase/poly-beta-1,6-N-acetylglucosamine synthase-like glycosyltransferase